MRWAIAITATLAAWGGSCWAQAPGSPPQSSSTSEPAPASDGLRDLSAMTLACPTAALNAAAREAAKAPTRGAYQFSYFETISGSHHARYEVHFESNYASEPDLKYCVMLYCQQGWDPATAQPSVTLLTGKSKSSSAGSHMESCAEPHPAPKRTKPAASSPQKTPK